MSITHIGCIIIPIMIICTMKLDMSNFILLTLFTSFFTSTAIIYVNIIDLHVGLQQFMAMLLTFKFIYELFISKNIEWKNLNIFLTLFIAYASISIFIPLVFNKGNNYVIGVSSHMDFSPVHFSITNMTQLLYLLIGYIVYSITYICISNKYINYEIFIARFNKAILYSAITLGVLGIIQMFLNDNIFNFIFRQYNYNNQQIEFLNQVVNRPSGPTGEPSFYALALVPMLCYIIYNLKTYIKENNKYLYTVSIVIIIIPLIVSKSSSFLIGILLFTGILILISIKKLIKNYKFIRTTYLKSFDKSKIILYTIISLLVICIIGIYIINSDIFRDFIYKIKGGGVSGSERTIALIQHLKVFKDNIIFGVGFGSLRSKDLMSTWLACMGLVGNILFALFFIRQLYCLLNINKRESISLAIMITISWGIMFISVPEPYYLYLWIYFAVSEYVISNQRLTGRINFKK
ncbi:hypothetical protein UT300013_23360 [Paraclostridium sordellii]